MAKKQEIAEVKKNLFSLTDKAGQPPKFKDPKQILTLANLYFEEIQNSKGAVKATITGIALYLGFESRQSFYDYEARPKFSYAIKRIRLFIEHCYENQLYTFNSTGAIFALKNMGWKDKVETENNSTVKVLNVNVELVPTANIPIARSENQIEE